MSKKRKRNKHPKYKNHNITPLSEHKRAGKRLPAAFEEIMKTGKMNFSSWIDFPLPDMMWAVIISSHLERDDCLQIFRDVVQSASENLKETKDHFISHASLALMSEQDFDKIAMPLKMRDDICDLLAALLLIDHLPDIHHWQRFLKKPNEESHYPILAKSVADCFDHQSQKSTDCRWLRVYYLIMTGSFHAPPEMIKKFIGYPNIGDMKQVRPSIRACEMTLRYPDILPNTDYAWGKLFWEEMYEKTICILPNVSEPKLDEERVSSLVISNIYQEVLSHFHNTQKNVETDSRHDGAFGLVLYGLYMTMEMTDSYNAFRAQARIILRTIVELYLTMKFLSFKDDPTIWAQYRNYGAGQSKLSFLKHISSDEVPEYIKIEDLENHANADHWLEFQDINLGAWSNKNLRAMAEEAGVKEIYDKYYDWPSGFVHGNWSAIRDTVFATCYNPLHKFHRVPVPPRLDMNDALIDVVKLLNLLLEELNKLYPTFKIRISSTPK